MDEADSAHDARAARAHSGLAWRRGLRGGVGAPHRMGSELCTQAAWRARGRVHRERLARVRGHARLERLHGRHRRRHRRRAAARRAWRLRVVYLLVLPWHRCGGRRASRDHLPEDSCGPAREHGLADGLARRRRPHQGRGHGGGGHGHHLAHLRPGAAREPGQLPSAGLLPRELHRPLPGHPLCGHAGDPGASDPWVPDRLVWPCDSRDLPGLWPDRRDPRHAHRDSGCPVDAPV